MKKNLIIALITLFSIPFIYASDAIKGSGSSLTHGLYQEWIKAYNIETGFKVNYTMKDSSQVITDVKTKTVDFAVTNKPLTTRGLKRSDAYQFPVAIGAIVMGYNLPKIKNLNLSHKALVEIAAGMVKFWDHNIIAEANPRINLPHKPLIFVHHSNASDTTYNFTYYLSKISKAWKFAYGTKEFLHWPGEQHASVKTNFDVANMVKQIPYSIGYIDYTNAKEINISMASLQNKTNGYIKPTIDSIQSATENITFNLKKDFFAIVANPNGKESYPLITTSFVLVPSTAPIINKDITKFYDWCYTNGQDIAISSGFIPLSKELTAKIRTYWNYKGI